MTTRTLTNLGLIPTGRIIRILQVTKTNIQTISGVTFADITGLSQAITPVGTTSKILVIAQVNGACDQVNNGSGGFRVLRDSTTLLQGDADGNRMRAAAPFSAGPSFGSQNAVSLFLDSPSTTLSITYKCQAAGSSTGDTNTYINRLFHAGDTNQPYVARSASSLTLLEFVP